MKKAVLILVLFVLTTSTAQAHLVLKVPQHAKEPWLHKVATMNLAHAEYVCVKGSGKPKRVHCRALKWLRWEVRRWTPAPPVTNWVAKQEYVATLVHEQSGGDPWPRCSDPWDGGSWTTLVNCENSGNWYDSPGYYRCGLQFDPMWERKYGQLCP